MSTLLLFVIGLPAADISSLPPPFIEIFKVESTHYNSSNSNRGGIIVMMTEQEKPLETYDEMVQEIEQEIIIHENIEIMEEEMPGTLDGYFHRAADNKNTLRDSMLD